MNMDSSAKNMIFGDELMPLVRDHLAAGQPVRYLSFRGISMLPMLRQGIDSVELSPLPARLKKYDLPVYQRSSGQYVMHRIVGVKDDHYICIGDNQFQFEKVRHSQMIGVVTAFTRGDRLWQVSNPIYKFYCRFWHISRPLRHFWRRGIGWLRRHLT